MIVTPAFAADQSVMPLLVTKAALAPAASVTAYNWAGWHVGGNIGYGWGISSDPDVSFVVVHSVSFHYPFVS